MKEEDFVSLSLSLSFGLYFVPFLGKERTKKKKKKKRASSLLFLSVFVCVSLSLLPTGELFYLFFFLSLSVSLFIICRGGGIISKLLEEGRILYFGCAPTSVI